MTQTKYTSYGVTLTAGQIRKIKKAHDSRLDVTIRIQSKALRQSLSKGNLSGNDKLNTNLTHVKLYLTESQINKIKKTDQGVQLKLSKAQLDHMEKVGGFLPLLGLLPAILGAVGGLAGGVASAVNSSKQTAEQKRHNQELESIAKGGSLKSILTKLGITKPDSNKITKGGCISCDGLYMQKIGDGLYLEPQGSGLFLGPSPTSLNSSVK
jgi:hypothetical protein